MEHPATALPGRPPLDADAASAMGAEVGVVAGPVIRAAVPTIALTRGASARAMRAGVEQDRKNG